MGSFASRPIEHPETGRKFNALSAAAARRDVPQPDIQ
jgi:hypothetical protein